MFKIIPFSRPSRLMHNLLSDWVKSKANLQVRLDRDQLFASIYSHQDLYNLQPCCLVSWVGSYQQHRGFTAKSCLIPLWDTKDRPKAGVCHLFSKSNQNSNPSCPSKVVSMQWPGQKMCDFERASLRWKSKIKATWRRMKKVFVFHVISWGFLFVGGSCYFHTVVLVWMWSC